MGEYTAADVTQSASRGKFIPGRTYCTYILTHNLQMFCVCVRARVCVSAGVRVGTYCELKDSAVRKLTETRKHSFTVNADNYLVVLLITNSPKKASKAINQPADKAKTNTNNIHNNYHPFRLTIRAYRHTFYLRN